MEAIDYSYFLNPHASRRRPALTRELTKLHYMAPKEAISLAEGMPNEVTFPFEKLNVVMKDGSSFCLKGAQLGAALQYLPSQGYPPLVKLLRDFTEEVHQPPIWDQRDVIITTGSQDGISKSIEMCLQDGEPVVVQNPLYSGTEVVLKPFRPTLIPVDQDEDGMVPHLLRTALEDWQKKCLMSDGELKMPKLLYINPTGSNPTGTTMPLERRLEVYRICCEYNILILEDDAYCFMNFASTTPPSFLSLDTQGRVLRFDSFSKVLSSGLRIGWVTAAKPLIQAIELQIQSSYLHCSTMSQVLTYNLLSSWGFEKLLTHFDSVRNYYKARRDVTLAAMDRHLTGLCEWSVPNGGMFVWIKVRGVPDVYDMILTRGIKKLITFVPGQVFMADQSEACSFIRASYSKANPKQIDRAMCLLAELIREEQALLKKKLDDCT